MKQKAEKYTCTRCGVPGGSTVLFKDVQACTNCLAELTEKLFEGSEELEAQNKQLKQDLKAAQDYHEASLLQFVEEIKILNDEITRLTKKGGE